MEQPKTPNAPDQAEKSKQTDQPASDKTQESSRPRHSRTQGRLSKKQRAEATPATSPALGSVEKVIEEERLRLMQVQAMLKCLYEVLLYADDEDSIMHADVANVAERLINDSVVRLGTVAQGSGQQ